MHRCLELAGVACSAVSPNPLVGALIVRNGKILGQGAHLRCGDAHAEIYALQQWQASVGDPKTLDQAVDSPTLYVSLEPCNHYGRTPPCTEAIIKHGIREVVFGAYDPHALVSGAGIRKLMEAGLRVRGPVLEHQCRWTNRRFETACLKHRPYIILKWAMSADGFMDQGGPGPGPRISGPMASLVTHQLRREQSAILIGARTLVRDNPDLRAWRLGKPHPCVVIATDDRPLDSSFRIFNRDAEPLILAWPKALPAEEMVKDWCHDLLEQGLNSVLVEGGRQTLDVFLQSGVWDEIHTFCNLSLSLNQGTYAPSPPCDPISDQWLGGDAYRIYRQGQYASLPPAH